MMSPEISEKEEGKREDVLEGGPMSHAEQWAGSSSQAAEPEPTQGIFPTAGMHMLCATGVWGGLLYNIIVKRLANTEFGIQKEALSVTKDKRGAWPLMPSISMSMTVCVSRCDQSLHVNIYCRKSVPAPSLDFGCMSGR